MQTLALDCRKCSKRLDKLPRLLPCGESICSKCNQLLIESFGINTRSSKEFKCSLCDTIHLKPAGEFPINKSLQAILIDFSKFRDEADSDLNINIFRIKAFIEYFEDNNGYDEIIEEYCNKLKNKLRIVIQELEVQIDYFKKKFETKINDFENAGKSNFDSNKINKNDLNKLCDELKKFYDDFNKKKNKNDQYVMDSNKQSDLLIKKAYKQQLMLESEIFNNNKLIFIPNKLINLNEKLVGKFINFDSEIISDEFEHFINICEFKKDQKWKLLYRASLDGFSASDFHSKCDNKLKTLSIIKTSEQSCLLEKSIFGGYTEQSWSGEGYKSDPNSFIFSLSKDMWSSPGLFKCKDGNSIRCGPSLGPSFGVDDLKISNESNIEYCRSINNSSYNLPSSTYLAGSNSFILDEIEVFQKID